MNFELGLEILLIVLLLPTFIYVVLLHRRLSSLRAERDAVDAVVERMNEATRRAEASLKGIRQTAEQAKAVLEDPMTKAQALRDELLFLVQRADVAGERLAGGLSGGGSVAPQEQGGKSKVVPAPAARPRSAARSARPAAEQPVADRPDEVDQEVRSQAERDLMNALRNAR